MYNSFDLIFFLGSLLAVLAVGFWSTRRQKSTVNDYFRGGNRLPWYAIGFSIIAAGISSEQFVGEMHGMRACGYGGAFLPPFSAVCIGISGE